MELAGGGNRRGGQAASLGAMALACAAALLGALGCGASDGERFDLNVRARTDVSSAAFTLVVTEVFDGDGTLVADGEYAAQKTDSFEDGAVVAQFPGLASGQYLVAAELLDAAGDSVLRSSVVVRLNRAQEASIWFDSACLDVECAADQVCAAGECIAAVPPRTDAGDGGGECRPGAAELCDGFDQDCDGKVDEGVTQSCTNACGAAGIQVCAGGTFGTCTAPPVPAEVCDEIDNDCDGAVDEGLNCEHEVICDLLDAQGMPMATGPASHFYGLNAGGFGNVICIPNGTAQGSCGVWISNCVAKAGGTGHAHTVTFELFSDAYAQNVEVSRVRLMVGSPVSGGANWCGDPVGGGAQVCRKWLGRATANSAAGHAHEVWCRTEDDNGASPSSHMDAVLWDGTDMVVPGGAARRWMAGCTTH
jgi:hypothetical protein